VKFLFAELFQINEKLKCKRLDASAFAQCAIHREGSVGC